MARTPKQRPVVDMSRVSLELPTQCTYEQARTAAQVLADLDAAKNGGGYNTTVYFSVEAPSPASLDSMEDYAIFSDEHKDANGNRFVANAATVYHDSRVLTSEAFAKKYWDDGLAHYFVAD